MGNSQENGEKEKGFAVRDKRFSAKTEEDAQTKAEEKREETPQEDVSKNDLPLPEISFNNFILSLSTSALIQLGEIQDPITKQSAKQLPSAKQTIDLISMLKEKTKGNLSSDEAKILEAILYDLRMRYVKATT
jgi:hypothetical protein